MQTLELPKTRCYLPSPAYKVLNSPNKRFRVLYGGRGSGKSTAFANYVITKALSSSRILCCREVQNSIRDSVYRLLVDRIIEMNLTEFFNITQDSIKSVYGGEIIFRGLKTNPAEIKSLQGVKIVWVEEAERVSEESWDILIPTIREPESEILISFNPESESSPVLKRFVYAQRDDVIAEKLNYDDNDLFPDVLRREMEYDRKNDYEKYLYIWEGNPKRYGQAVIFKKKLRIEEFPDPPEGTQYYVGADWGYSVDPTAIVQMFIKDYCLYINYDFYGHQVEIDQLPQALDTIPAIKQGFRIAADSARPETINHLANKGYNIEGAEKGKGSVEDGIGFLKSFEAIIIHPRCKGSIQDFENYRWKQDKITGEILPIALDKANHIPDACRYALEGYFKGGLSIFEVMPKLAGV